MKQKITHYIYIVFFLFSHKGFFAQDFTLKLASKNKNEIVVLNKVDYLKKHRDTMSLNREIDKVSNYLKYIGYFTNTIDSINIIDKKHIVYFSLNNKIDKAIINIRPNQKLLFKGLKINNNTISIPIKELEPTLVSVSKKMDRNGKSFSKIQLENIQTKGEVLFADIYIKESKKRVINNTIVKGYENFPKSYLKNYFNLKPNTVFNQQKIKDISDASKNLRFVSEIKPPEVLFTKDSTLLYMYLKKKQNNSFDGIINFASKENGGILFNGNVDLKLNNIINTGEKFELFWNSIGKERQELKLTTEIPYIFNSKISPELSFSIYKQDSTFLNTKFESKLSYNLNSKIKLGIIYNAENSEKLDNQINNSIETFSNYFFGFKFQYSIPQRDFFFNDKFSLEINPTLGQRETSENSSNQFKIETSISYVWDINLRNSLFIKNKTGYLNSNFYINNELFRIGGANSVRGYNEQSLFASSYSYFNIEYRYLTSKTSYFYTITDIGQAIINLESNNLIGIGLGYTFISNTSQINISTAVGESSFNTFNFENSKIILSWKTFF